MATISSSNSVVAPSEIDTINGYIDDYNVIKIKNEHGTLAIFTRNTSSTLDFKAALNGTPKKDVTPFQLGRYHLLSLDCSSLADDLSPLYRALGDSGFSATSKTSRAWQDISKNHGIQNKKKITFD